MKKNELIAYEYNHADMLRYEGHSAYFDADNLSVSSNLPRVNSSKHHVLIFRHALFVFLSHCVTVQTISKAKLEEGVAASCCVLLVLNDETLSSSWCQFEIECARTRGIPLLCVVDADKQTVRSIVDFYMESNHAYLFDEQVMVCTPQFVA